MSRLRLRCCPCCPAFPGHLKLTAVFGGEDNLSQQERLLVDEAAFLTLQLASINTWLARQPMLVDRRNRGRRRTTGTPAGRCRRTRPTP